ncbi:MAG TPA: hypothetical protein VNW73_04275 [Ktedonobacteraceae bacterium]|jgi:hypothetical protein|nr:hypothetical protein [Ktedonobacteraceae bacterium]
MNVSTTSFTPTQMILAWTLLILLLSWFILFTALALRDFVRNKVEWEDLATPSRSIPIGSILPKEEYHNLIGMAGDTAHHNRTNTETSRDGGTSLIKETM